MITRSETMWVLLHKRQLVSISKQEPTEWTDRRPCTVTWDEPDPEVETPADQLTGSVLAKQAELRAMGVCGAVFNDPQRGEVICIRDKHEGPHERNYQPDIQEGLK